MTAETYHDPLTPFYDACTRTYNDHLALATEVRMSRATMFELLTRMTPMHNRFTPLSVGWTSIASLTEPCRAGQVPVAADHDAPYGDALVRFESREALTTIHYVLVEWIHLFDVIDVPTTASEA